MNDLVPGGQTIFSLSPRTFDEAVAYAKILCDTDFVPKEFRGKYGNILVAVQMGAEVGLPPMQALQNIAVINGRPVIYGDAMWALVKNHPFCESTDEKFDDASMTATCTIKRRGSPAVVRTFSKTDAEKARLWGKDGPWTQYPRRMLQMRARSFACRDAIPEALKGLHPAEEAQDIPPQERDMGQADVVPFDPPKAIESAPPPAETVDEDTGEITRDTPTLITPSALKVLNAKLADKQLREQFCTEFHVADPSELKMSVVNAALGWIREHAEQSQ